MKVQKIVTQVLSITTKRLAAKPFLRNYESLGNQKTPSFLETEGELLFS
jgi:hypothetical protein